jgi:hypothetical protein
MILSYYVGFVRIVTLFFPYFGKLFRTPVSLVKASIVIRSGLTDIPILKYMITTTILFR